MQDPEYRDAGKEEERRLNQGLIEYIEKSPASFQAVSGLRRQLEDKGYEELEENHSWELQAGKGYYVIRNDSSIAAFRVPRDRKGGFQIMASHSDSPSFKLKENPEICVEDRYIKLNVERYGGMLMAPWFDRPLSIAGRAVVRTENGIGTRLVTLDRDLALIPNLAIHMNREVNDGYKYDPQKDLLPLTGMASSRGRLAELVAEAAGVRKEDVLGTDLFLYNRQRGSVWGVEEEFISAPRLDDLQCAYASMQGFLRAETSGSTPVCVVFDNEEVGSITRQGAAAPFLADVLQRISACLGRGMEEHRIALQNSFMISADNAHALHPDHPDKTDPTNRPFLNGGIVIKANANQKYTTDAVSQAVMRFYCEKAGVPFQTFVNRSDMAGGSTLGNISNTQVALNTVDIGLPQLAMHSPYETAGARDTVYLAHAAAAFFSGSVQMKGRWSYVLE